MTPFEIADHVLSERAGGRICVCAYHAPSGFIHFDGRDADEVVAPALGLSHSRPAKGVPLSARMTEPYGSLGIAADARLLKRLDQAGITLIAIASVLQMKEAQLMVDAGLEQEMRPVRPPLAPPRGGQLAVEMR